MKIPTPPKSAIQGLVVGAVATIIIGFWGMGWTTAGSANRMASDRADAAVVASLVPFCVAKAEHDGDATKLVKFKGEESPYTRTRLVADAGWATIPEASSPNDALARACAERLQAPKA